MFWNDLHGGRSGRIDRMSKHTLTWPRIFVLNTIWTLDSLLRAARALPLTQSISEWGTHRNNRRMDALISISSSELLASASFSNVQVVPSWFVFLVNTIYIELCYFSRYFTLLLAAVLEEITVLKRYIIYAVDLLGWKHKRNSVIHQGKQKQTTPRLTYFGTCKKRNLKNFQLYNVQ